MRKALRRTKKRRKIEHLNRDNQVEKENGEAEIDVNVPTEEQIHHDLA